MKSFKKIVEDILLRAWNNSDFSKIESQIAPKVNLHARGDTVTFGYEEFKEIVNKWKERIPDFKFELLQMIEEGELVAVYCLMKGTPVEEWRGYKPSGKSISVPHVFFMKFDENKLTEVWEINDYTVLENQLT